MWLLIRFSLRFRFVKIDKSITFEVNLLTFNGLQK